MVHMGEACEECTEHCLMMHRKRKNPAPLVTTFCKVMMGDDYSKTMFLPPNFASRVKKLAGKTAHLEDSFGEIFDVKLTEIDERLAFEGGWSTFALEHGLQKGDILVFHYMMKSHFVVLMYGPTGLPETRHFGSLNFPTRETKKSTNKLTTNGQTSSKVNTKRNNTSHESSSKGEPVVNEVNNVKAVGQKGKGAMMSPNKNIASSSPLVDKEPGQRSDPLVKNSVPDYMRAKSPTTVKPVVAEAESDGGQKNNVAASGGNLKETEVNRVQKLVALDGSLKNNVAASGGDGSDESVINRIQKPILESNGGQKGSVAVSGGGDKTEINRIEKLVESGGGRKNNVAASGGRADGTDINRLPKSLEKLIDKADKKRKESAAVPSEIAHGNSMHKRLKLADVSIKPGTQCVNKEPFAGISPIPMDKRVKREPIMNHGSGGLIEKDPIMNRGSGVSIKKEPTTDYGSVGLTRMTPKPEPIDYDETPLSGGFSNTPISAIMSSYEYIELPELPRSVKWKDNMVILLRNGADRWPVLYQYKFGLKALTKNWSIFAKEKGIKPGDKCEFVLESAPTSRFDCNVFNVHVTRQ